MKINKYIKILISIISIVIITIIYYFLADLSPDSIDTSNEIEGYINFVLIDESDQVLIDDNLDFYEEDTLFTLLNRNYEIVCADQNYQPDPSCSHKFLAGRVILEIEELESNWSDTVLTIYVNDKLATSGVSNISLNDGDQITIKRTDYNE
ncbi:MAG: hypothetical protein K9L64_01960 [Candidatus Izimaplasma sp.]|nr:hypothetical protein [Candidatus Izimaplasma bacterium]